MSSLLEAAEAFPEAAILAPKLIGTHGSVHESFKRNVFHREANKDRFHLPDAPCCAEFLSGAVWLMRMEHISRVGFFDPKIFLFYEDDDLCMRTREAGYSLVYVPQSVAYHAMGKSSPADAAMLFFKQKHMMLGRLYLEEKYRGNDAVKRLIRKLTWKNRLRLLGARITFQHRKALYYRARLSGIAAFGLTAIQ